MAQPSSSAFSAALATLGRRPEAPSAPSSSSPSALPAAGSLLSKMVAAAPAELSKKKIELYSNEYYYTCALGGIASCGLTHMAVTPLDVVKCNIQTNPTKYKGIGTGFRLIVAEQGAAGLFKGWVPTLIGYSAQGACKFGLYEYFKK